MNKADRAVATRTFWLRLAGTLLTAGLLVWLLLEQGLDNIVRALLMIPAWQLAAGLLLTLLSRLAVTMRWHVLLRASGEQVSARQTLRLTFAGLFASNYLPTTIGGDVVRLAGAVQLKSGRSAQRGISGARPAGWHGWDGLCAALGTGIIFTKRYADLYVYIWGQRAGWGQRRAGQVGPPQFCAEAFVELLLAGASNRRTPSARAADSFWFYPHSHGLYLFDHLVGAARDGAVCALAAGWWHLEYGLLCHTAARLDQRLWVARGICHPVVCPPGAYYP